MHIVNMVMPQRKYNLKCPYLMEDWDYIGVHNTANDASAKAEISYMIGNNYSTSFHGAIDDKMIVLGVPFNRNTFACGDGRNGPGNRKTLNFEICYSKSGGPRFDAAEELAAEYFAFLLKSKGRGIERLRRHYDYSKKYCPHRTMDLGWERFLNKVRKYLYAGELKYEVHVENIGWQGEKKDGELAGTEGKSLRTEAIKIFSDEPLQYRVHMADKGWGDWVPNGCMAGTVGESRRVEALEIISAKTPIKAQAHVEGIGWQEPVTGTQIKIGTEGRALRLEALKLEYV